MRGGEGIQKESFATRWVTFRATWAPTVVSWREARNERSDLPHLDCLNYSEKGLERTLRVAHGLLEGHSQHSAQHVWSQQADLVLTCVWLQGRQTGGHRKRAAVQEIRCGDRTQANQQIQPTTQLVGVWKQPRLWMRRDALLKGKIIDQSQQFDIQHNKSVQRGGQI